MIGAVRWPVGKNVVPLPGRESDGRVLIADDTLFVRILLRAILTEAAGAQIIICGGMSFRRTAVPAGWIRRGGDQVLRGAAIAAARKPKTTAAVTPRPVISNAPVKRPIHPERRASETIPTVTALPKPETGTKAPPPANLSSGS